MRDQKIIKINKELLQANKELRQLDVQKDEFISIAAHELKTPLTSIRGFAQLLQNEEILKDRKKVSYYLSIINQNTDRLYTLVVDLVDSSRLSLGKLKMNLEPTAVDDVFNEIRETMEVVIREKGLTPSFTMEENLPRMRTDYLRIMQILRNLLMNAIHFTEKGSIALHVSRKDRFVLFKVQDTGAGINKEGRKKLFSRFYQVDGSNRAKVGGSGLGLFICKGLVELMGGEIWFESEYGKGATFYFTVPIDKRRS